MVETGEKYRAELFMDGRRIQKSDSFIVRMETKKKLQVTILNDSPDASIGTFLNSSVLKSLNPTLMNFKTPIEQRQLLSDSRFVVVLRPDFPKYRESTFRALLEYVQDGGAILFLDPLGTMAAAKTPLAELLPTIPLKLRKISTLPALKDIAPSFKSFPEPANFLESIPNGSGIATMEQWGLPVFRWKRYGAGSAMFSAFPVSRNTFHNDAAWTETLRAVFAHQTTVRDNTRVVAALDEMTGITVPPVSTPKTIIAIYLLLLAVPLALGLRFRKTGIAWLGGGLLSLAFTAAILSKASHASSKGEGVFVSFLEISEPGTNSTTNDSYYSVMSTSDDSIALRSATPLTTISAIPPSETSLMMISSISGAPLEVEMKDGTSGIPDLNLHANAPRQFEMLASMDSKRSTSPPPNATLDAAGLKLSPWNCPRHLEPRAAWLLLPNDATPLAIKNGAILHANNTSGTFLGVGSLEHSIESFLKNGWKRPYPAIAVAVDSSEPSISISKKTIKHGKKIIIFPVNISAPSGHIRLEPGWTTLSPADTTTRLIMKGNDFKPTIVSRVDTTYLLKFETPPAFAALKPERIEIRLEYFNKGGNVSIEPSLIVPEEKENGTMGVLKTLDGTKTENGTIAFDVPKNAFSNGKGVVALKLTLKNHSLPMGDTIKANTWSVGSLDITIVGTMPGPAEKGFSL
jgi:hypothetical protein